MPTPLTPDPAIPDRWSPTEFGSLVAATSFDVPAASIAAYARWWQLESWLRLLAYLELRAHYGAEWLTRVDRRAENRAAREAERAYMGSADAQSPLAYLDAGKLFELIRDDWALFAPSLLPRTTWDGKVEELLHIRHRLGHCRRPHLDDLGRIEQTLRDIESGARVALDAYSSSELSAEATGELITGWCGRAHADARRLVHHAEHQYGIVFELRHSVRPWVDRSVLRVAAGEEVPGALWEARFHLTGAHYEVDARRFSGHGAVKALLDQTVFVVIESPWSLAITFPAVDSPAAVADAIGALFDALIDATTLPHQRSWKPDAEWPPDTSGLDLRFQVGTALSVYDASMGDVSLFGVSRTR
ncbi:MAG: hypothetical protein RIB67_07775 [Miltoncostaeaceae bacterium]